MAQAMELIELHDDAAWDALVDASPQGTVFSRSGYLASLARPVRRYAKMCGLPVERVTGCDIAAALMGAESYPHWQRIFLVLDTRETEAAVQRWAADHGMASRVAVTVTTSRSEEAPPSAAASRTAAHAATHTKTRFKSGS